MWTYILRRLLLIIPTMFGVTVVSFVIMQFAPGDPELVSANEASQMRADQTAGLYAITRRSLHLDKPLLLNVRYFIDYRPSLRTAAFFYVHTPEEVARDLPRWASDPTPEDQVRRDFARSLRGRRYFDRLVTDFDERLRSPERHRSLASAMRAAVKNWLSDVGPYGVSDAVALLDDPTLTPDERRGLTLMLHELFLEPDRRVFSVALTAGDLETERRQILAYWSRWRQLQSPPEEQLPEARKDELRLTVLEATALPTMYEVIAALNQKGSLRQSLTLADRLFLADWLLETDNFRTQNVITSLLADSSGGVGVRLVPDVRRTTDEELDQIVANWKAIYNARRTEFEYDTLTRITGFFFDTQYARMAWRLVTFQFGEAATRSKANVSDKLADAAWQSVPLMLMAQLVIYVIAIPLGILCGVNRGTMTDRSISVGLFLLYSVPPSVAAMLLLLNFAYIKEPIFPSVGLHSENAARLDPISWTLDFLHHAFLPVICLSLFSLASMAMYSRSSILDVLGQDYVRTARAKGLSPFRVIGKHAFRNSLIPILTLFSNFLPGLLGGSVIIEVLFNINGLGKLGWDSITQKDFPTQMALLYISALVVMISILITDLLYVVADPRINLGRKD